MPDQCNNDSNLTGPSVLLLLGHVSSLVVDVVSVRLSEREISLSLIKIETSGIVETVCKKEHENKKI